jgi:hypothetical protein
MEQVRFRCHKCRALLELPAANAGKKFRCPECLSVGLIPTASETGIQAGQALVQTSQPVAEELIGFREEDAPPPVQAPAGPRQIRDHDDLGGPRGGKSSRRRKLGEIREEKRDDAQDDHQVRASLRGWRKVRLGINIIYIALCVWTGTIILYFVSVPLLAWLTGRSMAAEAGGGASGGSQGGAIFFLMLTLLVMMIGLGVNIASMVGYCFCLFVPPRTGALWWAIGALALALLAFVFSFFALILPPVWLMSWLIGFVQFMVFLLFLRAVGVALDVSWLVKSIQSLLILAVVSISLWVFSIVAVVIFMGAVVTKDKPPEAADSCALVCGALLAGIVLFVLLITILIRYLRVLRDTGAQIEEELAQRRHVLSGAAGYTPKE